MMWSLVSDGAELKKKEKVKLRSLLSVISTVVIQRGKSVLSPGQEDTC